MGALSENEAAARGLYLLPRVGTTLATFFPGAVGYLLTSEFWICVPCTLLSFSAAPIAHLHSVGNSLAILAQVRISDPLVRSRSFTTCGRLVRMTWEAVVGGVPLRVPDYCTSLEHATVLHRQNILDYGRINACL